MSRMILYCTLQTQPVPAGVQQHRSRQPSDTHDDDVQHTCGQLEPDTTVPAASRQSTGRLRVPPPHDALQRDHTPTRQPKSPQGRSKHRRMDVGSGLPGRTHLSFGTTAGVDPSVATPQQRNGVRRMAPAHVWRVNTYHWLVARKSQFAAACQPRTPPSRPPRHLSPIRTQAATGMAH